MPKKASKQNASGRNEPSRWVSKIVGHEKVPASQLLANPFNHRKHPEKQRKVVAASIEELGFVKSVLVNRTTGRIIDGHERVMQALGVGDETLVDVEYVELSEEDEKKALLILDASSELAEVDAAQLDQLVADCAFGMESLDELAKEMLAECGQWQGDEGGEVLEDDVPDVAVNAVTKPGDLWVLGNHRLLCGDATVSANVDRLLNGDTVDLLLTDPPYGISWNGDYTRFRKKGEVTCTNQYEEIEGDRKSFDPLPWIGYPNVVLWGANLYAANLPVGTWLVWDKRAADGSAFLADAEVAWQKGGYGIYIKSINQQQQVSVLKDIEHPTKKPVELFAWCIQRFVDVGLVFDPYCGSGTAIIACEQLGKKCYGMEISPQYCDVIVKRWENLTGNKAVLETDNA
jgi:hypothetical protein